MLKERINGFNLLYFNESIAELNSDGLSHMGNCRIKLILIKCKVHMYL